MDTQYACSGGGDAGGHARASRSAAAPARRTVRDRRGRHGAVRLRRGRHADAEHGDLGAAAAGVHRPAGRRGTGAERELPRDPARRGAAGGIGGADPPPGARPAFQAGLARPASAAAWRGQGLSDAENRPRLGQAHTTVTRSAGAMLLPDVAGRADAAAVLAAAAGGGKAEDGGRRFADVALLAVTSICSALGAATIEQVKRLTAARAGPLAGLAVLPDLRTLRPRLAALARATDPAPLPAMFAAAILAAEPCASGVCYVDDHFVPYTGAKPVGKGWSNKRGRAENGRADTHVAAHDGRAVCFVTGEPSGLTVTLPPALAELKKAAGPGAKIILGFDRRGAYAPGVRHCRRHARHCGTY